MNIESGRWISSAEEVAALAEFSGRCIAAAGQPGHLHPGDVFHRAFGGNRLFDPTRFCHVWEDASGIAAWIMLQPKHPSYDIEVRPDLRSVDLEAELVEWGHFKLRKLMDELGMAGDIVGDTFTDDPIRVGAYESLGWRRGNDPYFLTIRSTSDAPPVELPDGYTLRTAADGDDPEDIAALHSAAFGSTWAPGQYAAYMSNPGYRPEREWLAVAPDGELAAFTVTWHDHISSRGLFEPVGTHPDHQRLGLGRAVMAAALRDMEAAGLEWANVAFIGTNPASRGLYLSMGFEVAHELIDYMPPEHV